MKKVALLALIYGCLSQISGAITFPQGSTAVGNCNLPNGVPSTVTANVGSNSGSVAVFGLVQRGSFLVDKFYQVTATTGGANIDIGVNQQTKFNRGHNKAYINFFTAGPNASSAFFTIDVNCSPQPTISLVTDAVDVSAAQAGSPGNILLKSEIKGANPGDVPNFQNPIRFTMTPDTGSSTSPWITGASVPGSPLNSGTVVPNGAQDLTVNINPAGLSAQADPYLGYLHIRDNNTGFGSADLTVRLAISASSTGNVTLPHVAINGPYVTGFYIVNTGTQGANYTLAFLDDNGQPFQVPIQGQPATSTIQGSLQPNGSAYIEVGDPNGQPLGGSVHVTADASVATQALFRLHLSDASGTHYYEAAVPGNAGSKEFVIPFDATKFAASGDQIFTGIAIANTETNQSNVTCVARDSSGAVIPNAVVVPPLAGNGHWAGFDFKPLVGLRGTIDCSSTTTITAMALHSFGQTISSLPVILK